MQDVERARAAENQRIFRDVNERMKDVQTDFSAGIERAAWVCECSAIDCADEVWMTIPEYEWVRADPRHFLVVPGHGELEIERPIVDAGRFSVVELRDAAPLAPAELLYYYRLGRRRGFEYVGELATDWTGYTPEEHYADPDLGVKIVHPGDRDLLEALGGQPELSPVILRWVARDGRLVVTEHHLAPVTAEHGEVVALAGRALLVREAAKNSSQAA